MITYLRKRATYANVVATIAVFLAMGGTGYALSLPRNSVGTVQLKKGAVTAKKIRRSAVSTAKVKNRSLKAADMKRGQILVWRSDWDSGLAYSRYSVVQAEGSSWVAARPISAGEDPGEGGWRTMAAQGPVGPEGLQGQQGSRGPEGDQGPQGPAGADGTFDSSGFHSDSACLDNITGALEIVGHGSAKSACDGLTETALSIVVQDHP